MRNLYVHVWESSFLRPFSRPGKWLLCLPLGQLLSNVQSSSRNFPLGIEFNVRYSPNYNQNIYALVYFWMTHLCINFRNSRIEVQDMRRIQIKVWLHYHFSFLNFWFSWSKVENLKSSFNGEFIFYLTLIANVQVMGIWHTWKHNKKTWTFSIIADKYHNCMVCMYKKYHAEPKP